MDETYIKVRAVGSTCIGPWISPAGPSILPQPKPERKRRQIVSPQCDEEPAHTHQDHTGRLCGVASRTARDERDRRTSARSKSAIEPIFEQSRRTGAPPN